MSETNFKVQLQRYVPQHLLSRLAGWLASSEWGWLKRFLINDFLSRYTVDLSEAESSDLAYYRSFNHFFTRKLAPHARPLDREATWVMPVDGIVSSVQPIESDSLLQAKGKTYSLKTLLVDPLLAKSFESGWATVFYLAPYHYHRVHLPVDGQLLKTIYVPGDLYSVNVETSLEIEQLYARNERLICVFETSSGLMTMILVGAMLVGSIKAVWKDAPYAARNLLIEDHHNQALHYKKGEEIGFFQMGSTVMVLSSNVKMQPSAPIKQAVAVKLGQCFVI